LEEAVLSVSECENDELKGGYENCHSTNIFYLQLRKIWEQSIDDGKIGFLKTESIWTDTKQWSRKFREKYFSRSIIENFFLHLGVIASRNNHQNVERKFFGLIIYSESPNNPFLQKK